jgi:hypothetical protein
MQQAVKQSSAVEKIKKVGAKKGMIKCRCYIQPRSIHLQQDTEDRQVYYLNFKYDATEDVKISVYYCAKQICNA